MNAGRTSTALVLVLAFALSEAVSADRVSAEPVEPPPEATPGEDYTVEPADSLAGGNVELGLAAAGRAGSSPSTRRRVRIHDGDMDGTLREGTGDPLAGSSLDGRAKSARYTLGKLAPRWGRGLVLGAPGDPWRRAASDRGGGAQFRGRAGEGFVVRAGGRTNAEAMAGRFARRELWGMRFAHRAMALGVLGGRRGGEQASFAFARRDGEAELAMDRRGGWRAEGLLTRALAPRLAPPLAPVPPSRKRVAASAWLLSMRVRAGLVDARSLAEPDRSGPAQALAIGLDGPLGAVRTSTLAALWRYRPGVTGGRAALEVRRPLAHHGALTFGLEEQRGARRDAPSRVPGIRQGWWAEWTGGTRSLLLSLRHEGWGAGPWARDEVRAVSTAGVDARGPWGLAVRVAHSVYRVQRGESLYLAEAESDRLVLRALSGEGSRTRLEARMPFAGGRVGATMQLTSTAVEREPRPQWTLDWTRRARLRETEAPAPP